MTANIEFSAICSLRKPEYLRTPRALRTTTLPFPPPPSSSSPSPFCYSRTCHQFSTLVLPAGLSDLAACLRFAVTVDIGFSSHLLSLYKVAATLCWIQTTGCLYYSV